MAVTRGGPDDRRDVFATAVAGVSALSFTTFGVWAMVAPRSFFDGLARFEPFNQHFVQDIGAFQLGIAAVLLLAAAQRRLGSLTVALLGAGVGAAAHVLSHLVGRHLGGNPASDIPIFTIIALLLLAAGGRRLARSS